MVELKIALSKIPTNTIQRTNRSISYILESTIGKHVKWFVPSLLLIIALAIGYSKLNKTSQENEIDNVIATSPNLSKIQKNKATVDQIDKDDNSKDIVKNSNNAEEDKQLTIDEIKHKIAYQNSSFGENPTVLTEEKIIQLENQKLIDKAFINIDEYQLSKPKSNNATDQLLEVLSKTPDHKDAIAGMEKIGEKYFQLISKAITKNDFITALKHSKSVNKFNIKTNNINTKYSIQKKSILESITSKDFTANDISSDKLKTIIKIVKIYSPEDESIERFNDLLKLKAGPQIGELLLDEMGIETILISKDLAVTTHEITVESYTEFAISTNRTTRKCKHEAGGFGSFFNTFTWSKPLFKQTPNHPVVCITQIDSQAYSEWLSEQTENKYRLPTKQEWLLLAEEKNNLFSACKTANTAGSESKKVRIKNQNYRCNDKFEFTAPVASFTINANGLYDIQGNVSEWIYCDQKPCDNPTAMGSSWYDGTKSNKLNMTEKYKMNTGYTHIGFRLVRDL